LTALGFYQRLKPKYDEPLSNVLVAFKINLRRYMMDVQENTELRLDAEQLALEVWRGRLTRVDPGYTGLGLSA
jgi:hypothetical protein